MALPLKDDPKAKQVLATRLYRDFHAMKTYGKEPESLESIISLFNEALAPFTHDQIQAAMLVHAQRSQEFPTPADIIGLIKRNGKPPLSESMYIQISKKTGEDRTPEDWEYLRDYQAEQQDGWADAPDPRKEAATMQENGRLRQELANLRDEYERLSGLLRAERAKKMPAPAQLTMPEKVQRTAQAMREAGAPEEDIQAFLSSSSIESVSV